MFLGLFGKKEHTSDYELIRSFRDSGYSGAVGVLFERYSHLVYGVCIEYLRDEDESKDAVLNIFEQLLADLKKHEIENFKGWLCKVAKNYCLLKIRARKTEVKRNSDYLAGEAETALPEDEDNRNRLLAEQLRLDKLPEAVASLGEEQKTCIRLFYLEEKSYKEISERTGFNQNQVKSHIQNGKRNLKIFLTEQDEKTVR
jgi:RNA polymerase sigma-70 factor (ECF subfamily)